MVNPAHHKQGRGRTLSDDATTPAQRHGLSFAKAKASYALRR